FQALMPEMSQKSLPLIVITYRSNAVSIITRANKPCELQPSLYNQEGIYKLKANLNIRLTEK
ncbi:MAG: hypothetical protein WCF60_04515, partial [Anaerobacillus sp.]